jgi:putative chitinase
MPHFNRSSALLFKRCVEAGIESPAELANIMGNASVETDGFRTMHERLGYSSVDNVIGAVRSAAVRYTREEIQAAVDSQDPKEVAKVLYQGRADLGNNMPGDGYKFHGRGYFQYTGRDNYTDFGNKFGVDLENNPEQAAEPEMAARLAIAYWKDKVPEKYREDAKHAGVIINGGPNGADARVTQSKSWKNTITQELIDSVKNGTLSADQLATLGVGGITRKGDHGAEVRNLQSHLRQLGYADDHGNPLGSDGNFGPATLNAVKAFQRDHGLPDDGVVGTNTSRAILHGTIQQISPQQSALTALTLDNYQHPGHPMYQQALAGVGALDQAQGRTTDLRSYNLAGVLALAARREGLERIDQVILSDDASRAFAVQGDIRSPLRRFADVDVVSGINTPLPQSSTGWPQVQAAGTQHVQAPTPSVQTADGPVAQSSMQR